MTCQQHLHINAGEAVDTTDLMSTLEHVKIKQGGFFFVKFGYDELSWMWSQPYMQQGSSFQVQFTWYVFELEEMGTSV